MDWVDASVFSLGKGGLWLRLKAERPILLDAELSCRPGEVLALVGPSGSGKTTLLRAIAGLYRPVWGKITCGSTVFLDTERGINLPPQARRVGMVFQDYALFPHLTALENVALPLRHLPRAERLARAVALLKLVHLSGLERHLPVALSGGQKQRVALARALARDPLVLLLDEPFSALDQVTRCRLRMEMAEIRRRLEFPILLVTHDLEEAEMLADRMAVIHRGRILQQGPPGEVLRRPANAEVARLVNIRNLFEGVIAALDAKSQTAWLHWRGGRLEVLCPEGFGVGERVDWCIPPAGVVLHSRLRPSHGVRENPLTGKILELVQSGGRVEVILAPDAAQDLRLYLNLPLHVAERNRLSLGESIGVSLLKQYLHLMPKSIKDSSLKAPPNGLGDC
jgi:molybdate transport system ATP-binding protein